MPTILLAEDEAAIAETVLYALRTEGFAVEHVMLGGEVLPRLRRGGIDLVLLDVGLPDRNGFDVCRELRAGSAVPVVFLTARNVEIAVWKLSNAHAPGGELYLISNELSGPVRNLSFEREFGKVIASLDVLSKIAADKENRTVVKAIQSLATAVFLPIK